MAKVTKLKPRPMKPKAKRAKRYYYDVVFVRYCEEVAHEVVRATSEAEALEEARKMLESGEICFEYADCNDDRNELYINACDDPNWVEPQTPEPLSQLVRLALLAQTLGLDGESEVQTHDRASGDT